MMGEGLLLCWGRVYMHVLAHVPVHACFPLLLRSSLNRSKELGFLSKSFHLQGQFHLSLHELRESHFYAGPSWIEHSTAVLWPA